MALFKKKKLTPGEVLMNRRAAIEQEEAERRLKAQRAAGIGNDRLIALTEGTGCRIEAAAPLVFQSIVGKERINVYFTQEPKTDGKSIWLGPVDITSPLAPVYVYGHGLHERHHVVYTDFSVIGQEMEAPVKTFLNVLEDIRVDKLGAEAYAGYLLWRRALISCHEFAGTAPWIKPQGAPFAAQCAMYAHLLLTVQELGMTELQPYLDQLAALIEPVLGPVIMRDFRIAVEHFGKCVSTDHCLECARGLWAILRGCFRIPRKNALPLPAAAPHKSHVEWGQGGAGGQFTLFAFDGSASAEALPKEEMKEIAAQKQWDQAAKSVMTPADWEQGVTDDDAFRQLLVTPESAGTDDTIGMVKSKLASEADWKVGSTETKRLMRQKFRASWRETAGLAPVFRQTLLHRVLKANRTSETGEWLDEDALAMLPAGETRVFLQDGGETGRSLAIEILVDSSGSMTDTDMTVAKVTALRLLEAFRSIKGYEASVSLFPGASAKGVSLIADRHTTVKDAIRNCDFVASYGGTPILQALFSAALRLGQSTADVKLAFVITDGWFADEQHVNDMLSTMEARGITTAMIGIGMSSKPMGKYIDRIECIRELPHAVRRVVEKLSRVLRFGFTEG